MNGSAGIRPTEVTKWFVDNVIGAAPPLTFELIAAGHSNLTFKVTDAAGALWVLRRPPLHQVLATAHDMAREHRVISALHGTVPVPRSVGLCEDESVNDRPFYVMEFVEGQVLRNEAAALQVPPEIRHAAGVSLVEVLASLHAVDPDSVGLGDLGRKQDYVARQLRRWKTQYEASQTSDRPSIGTLHDRLAARIPTQQRSGIVHGDYRLDNCMVGGSGQIVAVLDWELCTLGDVMADLAMLLAYWTEPGETMAGAEQYPTRAPGFIRRDEVTATYAEVTGLDMSDLDYYLTFANWRLACILEGVYSRYLGGAMGDKTAPVVDDFRAQIDARVEAAERHASQIA